MTHTWLASALFVIAMTARSPDARPERWVLNTFTLSGVAVEIAIEQTPGVHTAVTATFTPMDAAFHLYSKDLPKTGIRGIGRPTLLELLPSRSVKSAGPLTADKPSTDLLIPTLGLSFPTYPRGAVTLRLPVRTMKSSAEADVSVTYMACSEERCLNPVIGHRVAIKVPNGLVR